MNPQPKPRREIDDDYRAWIRTQNCCIGLLVHTCNGPTEGHHVPKFGLKGMGTKVSDRRCVPVCFNGHRYCEQNAREVAKQLETTIVYLNARYNREHPQRPRKVRVQRAVKLFASCPHCPRKLHPVRAGRFYCTMKRVYLEVA